VRNRLVSIALFVLATFSQSLAARDPDRLVLQNKLVCRVLEKDDGIWHTVSFSRADGSEELRVQSDEVLIRLMDGTELALLDYRARSDPVSRKTSGRTVVRIEYVPSRDLPPDAPKALTIEYSLRHKEPYLRKMITLVVGESQSIDRLEVERFRTELPCERGGRGEPVFIGKAWFVGLEYPGSETTSKEGLVTLAHYPGRVRIQDEKTHQWIIQSKTAVAGVGKKDDPLDLAFYDYLNTIRPRRRNMLHYNSWYDWRGDDLTIPNLVSTFEAFQKNLLDPYGIRMDAFVPDDGWQDYNSIWIPRKNLYLDGLGPLRKALEARGTRLGIWMPLNGTNLNTEWGVRQGYEKSDQGNFYCLAGPKYNAAIHEATRQLITQGNLLYYKHDFNHLRCTAPGHGHLPDDRHGHEANLDAELELLDYERRRQPQIFLNVTSSVWYSPWWLQHADSIWMNAEGDSGFNKAWPQLSPREWAMSFRDQTLYQRYKLDRHLVPVSDLMTHGIIHGKLESEGAGNETLREWSDYVVMYYGRGVQLKELYITPDLMTSDQWKVLGEATRWALKNRPTFQNAVWIGGDPRKGAVYGYVSWQEDRGIIVLRNVDIREQSIKVPFDKSVRYRGKPGRPFQGRVIYPFAEDLPAQFISGRPLPLTVPGASVMVLELRPGRARSSTPASVPPLAGASAHLESKYGRLEVRVPVPDEEMQRCDLLVIARSPRSAGSLNLKMDFRLNGQPASTRRAVSEGWIIDSLDLRPLRGKEVEIVVTLPDSGNGPFSSLEMTVSAWLAADRPVKARPAPRESIPFAISQSFRRQTVPLLADTKISQRTPRQTLNAGDLLTIKTAKMRLSVFDSNSEPQYRDKFIFLNGQKLACVPANQGTLSAWQSFILDLTPDQLEWVKMSNIVELTNTPGECYKFTGLALAVQLADGTWVQSTPDDTVHSSVANWVYAEGEIFKGDRSGEIRLSFE